MPDEVQGQCTKESGIIFRFFQLFYQHTTDRMGMKQRAQRRPYQLVLGLEMQEDECLADTGDLGYFAGPRSSESLLCKKGQSNIDNLRPPVFTAETLPVLPIRLYVPSYISNYLLILYKVLQPCQVIWKGLWSSRGKLYDRYTLHDTVDAMYNARG